MVTNEGDYLPIILQFVLPVGLLVIVVAGVWLMISGSRGESRRDMWSHFRVHLGTAFLISAITILLVDLQLRHEVRDIVRGIPDGVRIYISRGDVNLAQAVKKQIEDNHITYSKMEIHATLDLDENNPPKYVIYKWQMSYAVTNTGPSEMDWDFHTNVSSDLDEDPQAVIEDVTVKEGGREPNLIKDFEKNQKRPTLGAPDFVASFRQVIEKLKPGIPYQVTISYSIHDRLKGNCTHSLFQIVSGLKYNLTLDPDKFEYDIEADYPGGREPETPAPTSNLKGRPKLLHPYEILETLLPNQGFTLYWRYKGNKVGGQISAE